MKWKSILFSMFSLITASTTTTVNRFYTQNGKNSESAINKNKQDTRPAFIYFCEWDGWYIQATNPKTWQRFMILSTMKYIINLIVIS